MIVSTHSIGAAPLVPPGTSPLPRPAELEQAISFAYFDRLYAQTPDQYQEMLDLYAHEYSLYQKGIDESLAAKDETAFRRIKHKIIYSLHLLELSGLHHNMEVLAIQFDSMDGFDRLNARHAYISAFETILACIAEQRRKIG